MCLISVDLPAPLSPTIANTSPACSWRSTPRSASTGPKLLRRLVTSRIGVTVDEPVKGRTMRPKSTLPCLPPQFRFLFLIEKNQQQARGQLVFYGLKITLDYLELP